MVSFGDTSHIQYPRFSDLPPVKYEMPPISTGSFQLGVKGVKPMKKKVKPFKNAKRAKTAWRKQWTVAPPPFKIYEGPRWFIPAAAKLSQGERYKFGLLDTCNKKTFTKIYNEIKSNNAFNLLNFHEANTVLSESTLVPIKAAQAKQDYEWRRVRVLYSKLFKIKRFINFLIHLRRYRQCIRATVNTEDVVTMEIPKKPVYIVNLNYGHSYVYEASSLRKTINGRLLNSDYMFVNVCEPLNLLSNEPFTYIQYISLYYQLKAYGMCSVNLELFKSCGFDLNRFEKRYSQHLKLSAIDNHFKNEEDLVFETVYDYFTASADDLNIREGYIAAFKQDFNFKRPSPYVKLWIDLTRRKYIAEALHDSRELDRIVIESDQLFNIIHKIYVI